MNTVFSFPGLAEATNLFPITPGPTQQGVGLRRNSCISTTSVNPEKRKTA